MTKQVKQSGFTLIELMIVVGIVGILMAVAYPAYQDQVRKTKRADAQAGLTELAQFMERFYTSNGRYVNGGGAAPALPFTQTPTDENTKAYNLGLSAVNATSFTLQAVPIGGQAADPCGTLTLTNTGQKGVSGGSVSTCW